MSPVNLVLVAGEPLWPAVVQLAHARRSFDGPRRLIVLHSRENGRPTGPARRLVRLAREQFPDWTLESREIGAEPADLAREWEQLPPAEADQGWTIYLPELRPETSWIVQRALQRTDAEVLLTQPGPVTTEVLQVRPAEGGGWELSPREALRRDATELFPVEKLARCLLTDDGPTVEFQARPAEPLPVLPLTEAGLRLQWHWPQTFAAAGVTPAPADAASAFLRFLQGLLQSLGVEAALGEWKSRKGSDPRGSGAALWVHRGGRLSVLEPCLDAAPTDDAGDRLAPLQQIERAAEDRRRLSGAPVEWILVRPAVTFSRSEAALAAHLGLQLVDEATAADIVGWMARWFEVPVSETAAAVERRLRAAAAETGRRRAFAPEDPALLQQQASQGDPVVANVDGWLAQVQRARQQNWLLWTQQDTLWTRVPTEGRTDALQDWKLLVGVIAGVDLGSVQARLVGSAVEVWFPATAEVRKRLADWFRPFLNGPLTFVAARDRLAAEARVNPESLPTRRATPAPAPVAPPAPARPAPAAARPKSAGAPRRPTPPPPQRPRDVLADLDRALDDALGGPKP